MLNIGPHCLRNRVLLAPMAGVTDVPFRRVAWSAGVGYLVGEMVSDNPKLWHTNKSRLRRMPLPNCGPQVVQVAGSEPAQVAAAAQAQWRAGADIIDINFGCPAKKVCRKAAGSALLADPALVQAIAAAAVAAVPVPVTAKIRTGPCPASRNAHEIGTRLQDAGVAALAVHGRTRACRFMGQAEIDSVAAVKQCLQIPVFANGDISSSKDAAAVLAATGVDGVMIGRAALGAPWLLGQMAQALEAPASTSESPSLTAVVATMKSHLTHIHEFYGLEQGMRMARKHMSWYLEQQGLHGNKRQFNLLPSAEMQVAALDTLAHLVTQLAPADISQHWLQAA